MMLKAFVRLFPFLILQKELVLSLPGCSSNRPGWATHRTLRIPASMVTESSSEKAWTNALCCVYTYVEVSNSLSTPRLVAYDGSSFSINKNSAIDSMIEAYGEVCDMSMGNEDCQNKGSCVDNALDNPSPTRRPTQRPTRRPTPKPTSLPTPNPSTKPTFAPSFLPTISPSVNPTIASSSPPTTNPSTSSTLESSPLADPPVSPGLGNLVDSGENLIQSIGGDDMSSSGGILKKSSCAKQALCMIFVLFSSL